MNERNKKEIQIIVNGRKKLVAREEISYDELVRLAFDKPPTGQYIDFTTTYYEENGKNDGLLTKGKSVKIKEGTVFNVTPTDKS